MYPHQGRGEQENLSNIFPHKAGIAKVLYLLFITNI